VTAGSTPARLPAEHSGSGKEYVVIAPDVLILPIFPAVHSVNQTLLSGPYVIVESEAPA
jgi:hypothetical protein